MFRQYIQTGIADVQRRIVKAGYYKGSTAEGFAKESGIVIGDINHVHPFREGNGRTQLQYL
jgi:cell filamentation protein